MSPLLAIERLEALLEDEREALRRVDAERVAAIASDKEQLFDALVRSGAFEKPALAARLRELVAGVRRNGVLLAHARDCAREACVALGGVALHKAGKPPTARPRALSVTG